MSRFRVEILTREIHFVESNSHEDASEQAVALAQAKARPAYTIEPEANVEMCAEEAVAVVMEGTIQ